MGIELGSTRIKSVLCDEYGKVLASGFHEWENEFVGGHWTYSMTQVRLGLQESYKNLLIDYGTPITELDAVGISAMMHGYLAFDKDWNLLEPFRTWRDTTTAEAAALLTDKLHFNMPQRWSATHYCQAVLNGEKSVERVAHLQTLAGYVHFLLTGENVLGASDASGMFPLDGVNYDLPRAKEFDKLTNGDIISLLPRVVPAGNIAGRLTAVGAKLLDISGNLQAGAPFCPPEGDAGTGMVSTDSVACKSANISAGTSAFLMVVLEKPLNSYYREIDVVSTPDGKPVAMVHLNNCTNEINEWVDLFCEVAALCGASTDKGALFSKLFNKSLEADPGCGNITAYNYLSGEPIAGTSSGAPMVLRDSSGKMTLANFMKAQIYSAIAALTLGAEILGKEGVKIESVTAQGGFYKTDFIGQSATSAALRAPVTVLQNAGEGGAWGIALLAGYALTNGLSLGEYLDTIFKNSTKKTVMADKKEQQCYNAFYSRYKRQLGAERLAAKNNRTPRRKK